MPTPDLTRLTGRRVSLRYRLPDGRASDVVGVLLAAGGQIRVRPEWAPDLVLAAADVQAARAVPDPVVRPSSSLPKLAWMMDHGWPGLERERLGAWVLRRGGDGERADAVLVLGDPGMPVPQAVDEVERRYRGHGQPAVFQLEHPLPGSPRAEPAPGLAAELDRRGYRVRTRLVVMVAGLPETAPARSARVRWAQEPSREWIALGRDEAPDTVRRLLTAGPHHEFAELVAGRGAPTAVARLAVAHRWAGVSAFAVHPRCRRQGNGRELLAAVLHRARELGAGYGYGQVQEGNTAARALLEQAGFTAHHTVEFRAQATAGPP